MSRSEHHERIVAVHLRHFAEDLASQQARRGAALGIAIIVVNTL
jgi:hypothetical protein